MKKFLMTILILAMTVCGIIGIAACDKEKPDEGQNQGQVEDKDKNDQDKNKDSETQKPSSGQEQKPSAGEDEKPGTGSETTPGGEEGKDDEGNKGETNPPKNPEEQQPGTQNPPETKPEDPKEDEDDKGGEEEQNPQDPTNPDPDLPQGDEPGTDEPDPEPQPDEPEKGDHEHKWVYTALTGSDPSTATHIKTCTVAGCGEKVTEKCVFSAPQEVPETCTQDAYKGYTCQTCKQLIKVGYYDRGIPTRLAKGHKMSVCEQVGGSSYTANPQHKSHCENPGCDYEVTENCTFEGECVEATCEKPSSDTRVCTKCKGTPKLLTSTSALGHEFEYTQDSNSATKHHVRCKRDCCANKTFPDGDCVFVQTEETEGDCTNPGTITYECKDCGKQKTEVKKNASGHKYTKSNFCDVCHKDGLKTVNEKFGSIQLTRIIFTEEVKNVEKIYIGQNINGKDVHGIDNNAFNGFNNLTEIYIPKNVIAVGTKAFDGAPKLTTIYYAGTQKTWESLYADGYMGRTLKGNLQLPQSVSMSYEKSDEEIRKEWDIPNSSTASTIVALPAQDFKRIYA